MKTKGIASHVVVIINVIGLTKPSLWNNKMDTGDGQEAEGEKLDGMCTFPEGIATAVVEFRGSILYFFAHDDDEVRDE